MSLLKPRRITPALLAANRRNALRSTGPGTAAGKQAMRFSALKHGGYAAPKFGDQSTNVVGNKGAAPKPAERTGNALEKKALVRQVANLLRKSWHGRPARGFCPVTHGRDGTPVPRFSEQVEKSQPGPGMAGFAAAAA